MTDHSRLTVAGQPVLLKDLVEQRRALIERWLDEDAEKVELQDMDSVLHVSGVPVVAEPGHARSTCDGGRN